jgi:hypothetical protein
MICGRPQVAPTAARTNFADDAVNSLPGFSGAGEGVHACSADSIATKVLGFRA